MQIDANVINIIVSVLSGILATVALFLISPNIIAKPIYKLLQGRFGVNKTDEIIKYLEKLVEELKKCEVNGDSNLVTNTQIEEKKNMIIDNLRIEPVLTKDKIGINFKSNF